MVSEFTVKEGGKGCQRRNFKRERLGEEKKQDMIGGKGLAGMSGSTLRSLMLLDQVGGWLGNKLHRKLAQIIRATKRHGPLATGEEG